MSVRARLTLAFALGLLPSVLALAACSEDGVTPDCAAANGGCDPAAPNANPDAHVDAKPDTAIIPGTDSGSDTSVVQDTGTKDADAGGVDAKADAADASDAKKDG